jgi:uncharacterized protein YeaO (DUF488 family)
MTSAVNGSPLQVFTARYGYRGENWLDVSSASNMKRIEKGEAGGHRGIGMAFAPSRQLLTPFLRRRWLGIELDECEWGRYQQRYIEEMRESYRKQRSACDQVMQMGEVVLLCFCTDAKHCHRRVLAWIFSELGATNRGEISTPIRGA